MTNEKIFENFFDRLVNKKNFLKILSIICYWVFISAGTALAGDNIKEDILDAVEKKYSQKSFKASFIQTSKLAALDMVEKSSGIALFSHPGKMKWEYFEPEHHEIITNGEFLWIYQPRENQVMVGDASSFFKSGAGGVFLSDISLIRKKFFISLKEVTQDYVEISLKPKKENSDISLITIRISQKNHEIMRVVTHNPYDDTTLFEFTDIQFIKISPDVFEFEIPDGTSIIKLDEQ